MFGLGTMELVLILAVIILLFGAAKLPDLARGTGRALRIFKTETKGLMDDDKSDDAVASEKELEARNQAVQPVQPAQPVQPVTEAEIQAARERRDSAS